MTPHGMEHLWLEPAVSCWRPAPSAHRRSLQLSGLGPAELLCSRQQGRARHAWRGRQSAADHLQIRSALSRAHPLLEHRAALVGQGGDRPGVPGRCVASSGPMSTGALAAQGPLRRSSPGNGPERPAVPRARTAVAGRSWRAAAPLRALHGSQRPPALNPKRPWRQRAAALQC